MVYDKKRSGDPDYDDKVPPADHGTVVNAGDGTKVLLTPQGGPVTMDGEHYNLGGPKAEDLDTRPEPGGQAEVKAEVQTYSVEDTPLEQISEDEYRQRVDAGRTEAADVAQAEAPTTPAKAAKPATAKGDTSK